MQSISWSKFNLLRIKKARAKQDRQKQQDEECVMRVVHPKPDDFDFHNRVHRTVEGYVATDEYSLHIPLMNFKVIIYYFME
jgi:hypothetical protein